jgi:hypothetical protein
MPIADQIARNDLISEGSETQAKFVLKNLLDVLQIAVREYDFKEVRWENLEHVI